MKEWMNTRQAATYLGVTPGVLVSRARRYIVRKAESGRYGHYYKRDLDAYLESQIHGWMHGEIAKRYPRVGRTLIIYHCQRKLTPLGLRGKHKAAVYAPADVEALAACLGWRRKSET